MKTTTKRLKVENADLKNKLEKINDIMEVSAATTNEVLLDQQKILTQIMQHMKIHVEVVTLKVTNKPKGESRCSKSAKEKEVLSKEAKGGSKGKTV